MKENVSAEYLFGQLEQAVNQSSISIVVTDISGKIVYVNNAVALITGYSREELLGNKPGILKSGFHSEAFYRELWDTILSGKTWKGEFYNKRKDGSFYWEAATISPVIDASGRISNFVCSKEDITRKKESEEALLRSESKFRSFFASSNAKIIVIDPSNETIIEANDSAIEYYGYTVKEFRKLDLKNEFIGILETVKVELSEGADGYRNIYVQKHRLKNGQLRDVEIFPARVIFDDKILIYLIVQDITQRKKAIEALKESEAKKLALLKIIPDLIFVLSNDGLFLDIYTDQPDRLILPPYQLLGKNYEQVFSPELSKLFHEYIKLALETRTIQSFEHKSKRADGTSLYEEVRIISSGDEEFLVIMSDITKQKQTEFELKKAWEEAKEANRTKSAFLANISHEIRTPINSILGFSDLLASELSDPNHLKHLDSIKSSSKTLLSLINDVLDLSKIEAGKMNIRHHDMSLLQVINEIENIFSIPVAEKHLDFSVFIDNKVPHIIIFDEMRLRQILINLVSNAVKFTDKGGVKIQIVASNRVQHEEKQYTDLLIEVSDTGIGIREQNLKQIFEAFKQQDEQDTRKYGGTGLGLTITQKLTELLGGDIRVESKPGVGSKFSVFFYQVEVSGKAPIAATLHKDFKIGHFIFKPATLLIADDDKFNRDFLKGLFKGSSMRFLEAGDGDEAIELVKQYSPVLALLDIRMPKTDGLDVAKFIKTNELFKHIFVVGISATPLTQSSDMRIIYLDDFVPKPVNTQLFIRKMSHFLEVDAESPASAKNQQPAKQAVQIQGSVIGSLKRVIHNEIEPAFQKLSNTSSFAEYEKFGKILIKSGNELKINQLTYIGNAMVEAVKTFDLDSLSKLVSEYKNLEKNFI